MYSPGASGILAEAYILLILSLTLILLRAYIRLRITAKSAQGWKWDDTSIVIAWIFLLIGVILIQLKIDLGLGQHIWELPDPKRTGPHIKKYNIFFEMVCVLCTWMTKISISIYILRIRDDIKLRWILWVLMILMTMATFATIVILSIACVPLKKLWRPHTPGKCRELSTIYNVAYVQSALTVVIDLGLSLLPIYILWNIKIAKAKKTYICTLMSLGLIATISNALRNAYTETLTTKDFTYNQIPVTCVAYLEMGIGIIAACIPTCVGILRVKKRDTQNSSGYLSSGTMLKNSRGTGASSKGAMDTLNSYRTLDGEDGSDLIPLSRISSNEPSKRLAAGDSSN